MNPLQTTKSNLLMCSIIIGTFSISTGCKITSLAKPQPKNFKFWETEDKLSASENAKTPPPPARNFSPIPLESAEEDIVMDLKSPFGEATHPTGSINDLREEATSGSAISRNPIRKPYQLSASSTNLPPNSIKSPDNFAGRDLPNVKPNEFAGQFKSNNNDFNSNQNSTKIDSQPKSGFKAPSPAMLEKSPNMLSYSGALTNNPAFQFNKGKSENSLLETKPKLLTAQEQLKAIQNNKLTQNPIKPILPQLASQAPADQAFQNPSQPFAKPLTPKLTTKSPFSSTEFDSFAQKPPRSNDLSKSSFNETTGFNKTFTPQAFTAPKAQPIPPVIDSFDNKEVIQNTSVEVDLPPSILHGKSSYAPGSTKKLIPN